MKILLETPTQLILKHSAYGQILLGIVAILIGIVCVPLFLSKGIIILIVTLIFSLGGLLAIVLAKFITITIDKSTNKISLNYKSFLGNKQQDIAIDQVAEVRISETINRSAPVRTTNLGIGIAQNTSTTLNFILVFYLKNGQGFPIPMGSSGMGGFSIGGIPLNMFSGRNKKIELGNKIAGFIGVPFKDNRPPTISDFTSMIGQLTNQNNNQPPIQNTTTPTIQN